MTTKVAKQYGLSFVVSSSITFCLHVRFHSFVQRFPVEGFIVYMPFHE